MTNQIPSMTFQYAMVSFSHGAFQPLGNWITKKWKNMLCFGFGVIWFDSSICIVKTKTNQSAHRLHLVMPCHNFKFNLAELFLFFYVNHKCKFIAYLSLDFYCRPTVIQKKKMVKISSKYHVHLLEFHNQIIFEVTILILPDILSCETHFFLSV